MVVGAGEAGLDGVLHGDGELLHFLHDFIDGDASAGGFVFGGGLPKRLVWSGGFHFSATGEGNFEIAAREDGEDGVEETVAGGTESLRDVFQGGLVRDLAGVEAEDAGSVMMGMPGGKFCGEGFGDVVLFAAEGFVFQPEEDEVKVSGSGHGEAVDGLKFDHTAAGGDGIEVGEVAAFSGDFESVKIGMRGIVGGVVDDRFDVLAGEFFGVGGESFVVGFPAEDAAVEAEVGALIDVGGDKRAVRIVVGDEAGDGFSGEVAGDPADAVGGGTVRAAGATHDGAEDVIEDAGRIRHGGMMARVGLVLQLKVKLLFYAFCENLFVFTRHSR